MKGDPECSDRCPCRDPHHPMHKGDDCGAYGWNDGTEYVCQLVPNHGGKHWDISEGWEW